MTGWFAMVRLCSWPVVLVLDYVRMASVSKLDGNSIGHDRK